MAPASPRDAVVVVRVCVVGGAEEDVGADEVILSDELFKVVVLELLILVSVAFLVINPFERKDPMTSPKLAQGVGSTGANVEEAVGC